MFGYGTGKLENCFQVKRAKNLKFKKEKTNNFQLSLASIDYRRCRFPSNYTLRPASVKDKNLPASIQLEKFIVDEGANLYFKFNEFLKNICNAVIKDLESMHYGNRAVQQFKNKIIKYQERYLPCKTLHREEDMISVYEKVIDRYDHSSNYIKDNNAKLIAKALDKRNAFNSTKNFAQELERFNTKFEVKFKQLKEPIKQENQELSKELNEWYTDDYKTVNGAFNKFSMILDLPFDYWFLEYDDDTEFDRSAINYVLF